MLLEPGRRTLTGSSSESLPWSLSWKSMTLVISLVIDPTRWIVFVSARLRQPTGVSFHSSGVTRAIVRCGSAVAYEEGSAVLMRP